MLGGDVLEVVLVEVGVEPGAGVVQVAVVLGSGQRGETVRLEEIDGELAPG